MVSDLDKMASLLDELVNKVDSLEKENGELKQQLQAKTAAATPAPAPVVSDSVAQETCDALVKAGAIEQSQVSETKKAFMENPEAAHKAIQALLYAQPLEKSASAEPTENLSGGTIIGFAPTQVDPFVACINRMEAILNY